MEMLISQTLLLDDNCEIVQNMEQAQATLVEMNKNEIQRGHVIKQRSQRFGIIIMLNRSTY